MTTTSSTIYEDKKYYNTSQLNHRRVNMLCSVSTTETQDISTKNQLKYDVIFLLKVLVKSSNLWTQRLTDKQLLIYNIINELREEGLKYYEISHILNEETDLTTIRGKKFCSSGVHSSHIKIGKNLDRLKSQNRSEIKDIKISFEEKNSKN